MLVDTSGFLCLHNRQEPFHDLAVRVMNVARRRLTHSYVLAEFMALAQGRRLPRLPALKFLGELTENPAIEVVWVDKALHRDGLALLLARLDKEYTLCDAVSFLLVRRRNLADALTTDHHFQHDPSRVPLLRPGQRPPDLRRGVDLPAHGRGGGDRAVPDRGGGLR